MADHSPLIEEDLQASDLKRFGSAKGPVGIRRPGLSLLPLVTEWETPYRDAGTTEPSVALGRTAM